MLGQPGSDDLTLQVVETLDTLLPENTDRFAIAYSGGGDSAALLHLLKDHPKRAIALIVDHGLREGSASEAETAADYARTLGYQVEILRWRNNKPQSGIQEKARRARYGLLGQACRRLGISALLTAHTCDDQAETLFMRYEHGTGWRGAAGMASRKYGSIWPELAGVFLIRPLLNVSRQSLRDYNRDNNVKWVEDPSNLDTKYERIRARNYLAGKPAQVKNLLQTAEDLRAGLDVEKNVMRLWAQQNIDVDDNGIFHLSAIAHSQTLSALIQIASGTGAPVSKSKVEGLKHLMRSDDFVSATLGGAMIEKTNKGYAVFRDPVIAKGRKNSRPIKPQPVPNFGKGPLIWDGRFEISDRLKNRPIDNILTVGPLWGGISGLEKSQSEGLKTIPPLARASLPAIYNEGDLIGWGHGNFDHISVKALNVERFSHLF